MVQKIDKQTGEVIEIKMGGLYAPFPIPAYRALAYAGEFKAQTVLVCLISHLGNSGNRVWPTYTRISEQSGIHRSSIKKALDVLVEFGFIKVYTNSRGKKKKNAYLISNSCYDINQFNQKASQFKLNMFICRRCAKKLSSGEFSVGPSSRIHLGCGGEVIPMSKIKYATVI